MAIAMAFACLPQVIVLDEPTTGLDVSLNDGYWILSGAINESLESHACT